MVKITGAQHIANAISICQNNKKIIGKELEEPIPRTGDTLKNQYDKFRYF